MNHHAAVIFNEDEPLFVLIIWLQRFLRPSTQHRY